jgi:hypothetical protein
MVKKIQLKLGVLRRLLRRDKFKRVSGERIVIITSIECIDSPPNKKAPGI